MDWLAIVTGALNELIYDYNFEEHGSENAQDTAALFMAMFDRFCFDNQEECRLIGEIVTFAGPSNPSANWLPADGASYLRSDYPDLFGVIGTTYGTTDSTHFNVPDLQSRVNLGAGTGPGLSTYALGATGGEESHVLTTSELASHSHSDAGHSHTEGSASPTVGAAITGVPIPSAVPIPSITGTGFASISSAGSDAPHNNIQPYIALNYFIVAK